MEKDIRRIGGSRYWRVTKAISKSDANKMAEIIRKSGGAARVIKLKSGLYSSPESK